MNPGEVTAVPAAGWDPRIRVFRCPPVVDSFVVVTRRLLVVVDTLISATAMRQVMSMLAPELPGRRLLVVNTHGDWDHVWGNAVFSAGDAPFPAPLLAHHLAPERMSGPEAERALAAMQTQQPDVYRTASWVRPDVLLRGGEILDGGDLTLELIPTPGHTPDHLAVWMPEIETLLAGDAAEAPLPFVGSGRTLPILRASLEHMESLRPRTVLYCHAPGVSSPSTIARNRAYFDELEARCRAAGGIPDWPLEAALPDLVPADPEQVEFYRGAHRQAIDAMVEWLSLA